MYTEFYNLAREPFASEIDTLFFYPSDLHRTALSQLSYGIRERKGFILLTGDPGSGKTTVCRALFNTFDTHIKAVLILNPEFSDLELLKKIAAGFGIGANFRNKYDAIEKLNEFFIEQSHRGNNIVLIIDDAQKLKPKHLEQLRLLSNLETEKEKLIQIILCGQAELFDKLKRAGLRQVDQRILLRYYLSGIESNDVKEYINYRIKTARRDDTLEKFPQFTDEAIQSIYRLSDGIPRIINLIAARMLLAGCSLETYLLDENLAYQCAEQVLTK